MLGYGNGKKNLGPSPRRGSRHVHSYCGPPTAGGSSAGATGGGATPSGSRTPSPGRGHLSWHFLQHRLDPSIRQDKAYLGSSGRCPSAMSLMNNYAMSMSSSSSSGSPPPPAQQLQLPQLPQMAQQQQPMGAGAIGLVSHGLSTMSLERRCSSTCSLSGVDSSGHPDLSLPGSGSEGNFRSPTHARQCLTRMEDFLMKLTLTDVTLVAGGRRFGAHRVMLSAASDYFAAMFTSSLREATQEEIEMHDVDPDALWDLIRYCYTGQLEVREETVEKLLVTSQLLLLADVVDACSSFLLSKLHPSNCLGMLQFAEAHACPELLRGAHEYFTDHFMEVAENQEFLLLSANQLAHWISSDDLNLPSEEAVFKAVLRWLHHDVSTRKSDVGRLLSCVRLSQLSPEFIMDRIDSDPIFKEDRVCQLLILEALKHHLLPERSTLMIGGVQNSKPRKSTVGAMYAVGCVEAGPKGSFTLEKYDNRRNEWTVEGKMGGRRLQFGVAVLEGKIFVVGGRDGLKTLNTVECYDPETKRWTSMPPMSTHRHGLGVGVLGGPLYAVGGHDGWSYLNTVERWDPITKKWNYVAPMSTQRSTVGVAVLGKRLFAVGGRDGNACFNTVECYDPYTNRWAACAPMSRRRGGVGVAVVNGFLYAVGGHDVPAVNHPTARFDSVERYDPKTDTWTVVASLPQARDAIGVVVLGDRLFAVGGYDGHQYLNNVESYDPQVNEWTEMCPMRSGRAGTFLCVVPPASSRHTPGHLLDVCGNAADVDICGAAGASGAQAPPGM